MRKIALLILTFFPLLAPLNAFAMGNTGMTKEEINAREAKSKAAIDANEAREKADIQADKDRKMVAIDAKEARRENHE